MGNYLSCTGLSISVLIAVDIFLRQENSKSSKYILSRSLDEAIYLIHYASEVTAMTGVICPSMLSINLAIDPGRRLLVFGTWQFVPESTPNP